MPPGKYRLARGMSRILPEYPNLVKFGGCHLFSSTEEVLHNVRNGAPYSIWGSGSPNALDLFAELTTLRDAAIPAFLEGRMAPGAFRAVMKVARHASVGCNGYEMTASERGHVSLALGEDGPKSAFTGLPADADLYCTLSAAETRRFFETIEAGYTQNWPAPPGTAKALRRAKKGASEAPVPVLRDCALVQELRNAARAYRRKRPVLAHYFC